MDKETIEIKSFFSDLLRKNGDSEQSLGWTKRKQNVRFRQLFRFISDDEISVLDVGCGFGDLYSYLSNRTEYRSVDYWGIDLMPEFVEMAIKKHPMIRERFIIGNFLHMDFDRKWDWVIGSGIFGHQLYETDDEMYQYVETTIGKALDVANQGVSFNFLSDKVDFRADNSCFFANPERILSILYKFSRNIIVDNSVMPFEYCVTVWKDDSFLKENTLFCNYKEETN